MDISLFDFAVPGGNTDVVIVNGTAGDDRIGVPSNGVGDVAGWPPGCVSPGPTRPATGWRSTASAATT